MHTSMAHAHERRRREDQEKRKTITSLLVCLQGDALTRILTATRHEVKGMTPNIQRSRMLHLGEVRMANALVQAATITTEGSTLTEAAGSEEWQRAHTETSAVHASVGEGERGDRKRARSSMRTPMAPGSEQVVPGSADSHVSATQLTPFSASQLLSQHRLSYGWALRDTPQIGGEEEESGQGGGEL